MRRAADSIATRRASATRRTALGVVVLACLAAGPAHAADALGDARLFFSPHERGSADGTGVEGGRSARDPSEHDSTGRGTVTRSAIGNETRVATKRSVTPALEAILNVGGRLRVIVGGRVCRGDREGSELRCDRPPEGIDTLVLAADGRGLLVTFADGRRRRLAVGEAVTP